MSGRLVSLVLRVGSSNKPKSDLIFANATYKTARINLRSSWSAERLQDPAISEFFVVLKDNILPFILDIAMLLAGFIVALQLNVFTSTWALATYPAVLITRSVLGDLLNSQVSTALHLGTAYPRLTSNTRAFYDLLLSMIVQTIILSFVTSAFAMIIGSVFWSTSVMDFPVLLFTVIATSGLGLLIYLLTEILVFTAFCRGLDLERFIHPLTIVLSGILITGLYVLMLKLPLYVVISISSLSIVAAIISTTPGLKSKDFRLIVRKPMVAFVLVAFVSIVAGTVFKRISALGLVKPEFYTAYPALVFISINVGLFVGSTATTKLALGLLKPSFRAVRNHGTQILAGWITSMIAFAILSGFSLAINGAFSVTQFGHVLAVLLTTNVIATIAVVLVSYAFAVLTFQRGLELDSFAAPIENSLAVLILTIALLVALVALW